MKRARPDSRIPRARSARRFRSLGKIRGDFSRPFAAAKQESKVSRPFAVATVKEEPKPSVPPLPPKPFVPRRSPPRRTGKSSPGTGAALPPKKRRKLRGTRKTRNLRPVRCRRLPARIRPLPDERVFVDRRYPTITNNVVTLTLGVHFDLRRVALHLPCTEHKPETFAAITIRIDGVTALVFATGKVVVTGAKTEAASQLAAHRFRLFLERVLQPVVRRDPATGVPYLSVESLQEYTRFDSFSVVNIVGSGRAMDGAIALCRYKQQARSCTEWDPALFPGMRLIVARCAECPLVEVDQIMAHVFDTGRCVIMGARCPEDVYAGQRYLTEIMAPFFDPNAPISSAKRFQYRLDQLLKNEHVSEAPKKKKKRRAPSALDDTPMTCLERVLDREEMAIVERMAQQETVDDEREAREAAERDAADREDGED